MGVGGQRGGGFRRKGSCSATAALKSESFVRPPIKKAETRANRAAGHINGVLRIVRTQGGVSATRLISHRPAGATKGAPEAFQIRDWKLGRPSGSVIVA